MNAWQNMERLTAGLRTKADKIRRLGAAGYARQQIADFLGVRYQHVRNVLVDAEKMRLAVEKAGTAEPLQPLPADGEGGSGGIRVRLNGDVVIPATVMARAGFRPGDPVALHREQDGEIHLLSREEALRRAQALIRAFVPEGISVIDEIAKRRDPPAAV